MGHQNDRCLFTKRLHVPIGSGAFALKVALTAARFFSARSYSSSARSSSLDLVLLISQQRGTLISDLVIEFIVIYFE